MARGGFPQLTEQQGTVMYKLMVKRLGRWEQVGFDHATVAGARSEAFLVWREYVFIVIPT